MASPSSWLQSLLSSPAKNWFSAQRLKLLSKRLRNYGFAMGSVLTGLKSNEEALRSLQEQEEEHMHNLRSHSFPSIGEVEKIIGYSFNNQSLLQQAFTHPSYHGKCVSYERLEYLGDSVLNFLITKQQFFMYANRPPGLLSPLRAANVDTEKLARVAVKHNLHRYLRHKWPILNEQIQAFVCALPDYPLHSHGLIDAPKVLADIVESTIGAVYVDSNSSIEITWEVAKGVLEPIITPEMLERNPVQKLYEMCEKNKLKVRIVDLWSQEGVYEVFINNKRRGKGKYHAKKEIALNRAANAAYNEIVRRLGVKADINNIS